MTSTYREDTPTFIIDWPALIAIGLLFGYGIKGTPTKSVLMTRAYFCGKIVVTLFVALVYYSYLLAPDWMWMYFVKASDVPSWIVWYVLILYYFAFALGFVLKMELAKIHSKLPILAVILAVASAVLVTVPLGHRYMNVGSLEQYQAGQTTPLPQSPVGRVPGNLTGILIPLGFGLIYWSRKEKFS
jgi:hypothetical protein